MKRAITALFGASVLAMLLSGCATTTRSPAPDDQAIRDTLKVLNSSLTARDIDLFMGLFEHSDDILLVGPDPGQVYRGWDAIRHYMFQVFHLPAVASFDLRDVVVKQNGDSAWVYVGGPALRTVDQGPSGGAMTHEPYRYTVVMVREDGHWRWQLFHGSVPGAGGRASVSAPARSAGST